MAIHWYEKAKRIAKEKGITYQQIADDFGVEKSTVGHWMVGRNKANIDQIMKIALILETPVTELIFDDVCVVENPSHKKILELVRETPEEYLPQLHRMVAAFVSSVKETPDKK